MSPQDAITLIGIGGFFLALGIAGLLWGRREDKRYYEAIARHRDVREFLAHWPKRPEPGSIKVGGWIALAIGLILLIMGGVFLTKG